MQCKCHFLSSASILRSWVPYSSNLRSCRWVIQCILWLLCWAHGCTKEHERDPTRMLGNLLHKDVSRTQSAITRKLYKYVRKRNSPHSAWKPFIHFLAFLWSGRHYAMGFTTWSCTVSNCSKCAHLFDNSHKKNSLHIYKLSLAASSPFITVSVLCLALPITLLLTASAILGDTNPGVFTSCFQDRTSALHLQSLRSLQFEDRVERYVLYISCFG